jgi:hypothetical protein
MDDLRGVRLAGQPELSNGDAWTRPAVLFHGGDADFGSAMVRRQEDEVFVCVMTNSRREDRALDRGVLMSTLLAAV